MNTTDEDLVLYVAIGERELRLVGGSLRTSIHDLPKADVTVNTDQVHSTPVDYLQPVEIRNALGEEAFNGNVQRATPDGSKVELECIGGISLTESIMPAYVAQDCSHIEIVYTAAREAGFSDDRMVIQGLDDLPCEAIEVVAPLIGVSVPAPVKVGDVEFAPATAAQDVLARFNPRPDLADEFERATGVARAYVVGARLLDAEQEGLEQIELALGWLTVRGNFGFAMLPKGTLQRFDRAHALARCRRLPVVAVCGTEAARRWLRRPVTDRVERQLDLSPEAQLDHPALSSELAASDANAVLAARRAILPGEPIQRLHALWEAFEFYVGSKTLPSLFSDEDRKDILDAVKDRLSATQRNRLIQMVNGPLNDTPLMGKLLATLEEEAIELSEPEASALRRLRRVRGRTSHGSADLPTPDDLQYGCCVLSRALVTRLGKTS